MTGNKNSRPVAYDFFESTELAGNTLKFPEKNLESLGSYEISFYQTIQRSDCFIYRTDGNIKKSIKFFFSITPTSFCDI